MPLVSHLWAPEVIRMVFFPAQSLFNGGGFTAGVNCAECAPPSPLSVNYFIDPCTDLGPGNGVNPGLITLVVTGGQPNYTVSWSGAVSGSGLTADFTGPTLFSATVTNTNGQSASISGFTGPCTGDIMKTHDPVPQPITALSETWRALAYPNPFQNKLPFNSIYPKMDQWKL